jgi:nicotinate-nucleotide adenylyltransferase
MKIALLGGSFNPPHIGHMLIAQQVLDFGGVDEVWFLPNWGQSFEKPVASVEDRLAMTRCLHMTKTKVSTLEIDNTLNGQTITLLPYLPKEHTYVFIIGSDQLPVFHLWGKWKELLEKMPFLIFPRYGFPTEPVYPNMTVLHHDELVVSNISSTKIRARVSLGLSVDEFVPKGVGEYIRKHSLYLK